MTIALVCRRTQLREAAIVLSHLPDPVRTPLVVLDPPPVTQAEYATRYSAYRNSADARDAGTVFTPGDRRDLDSLLGRLTSYRQWVKHQSAVASVLERSRVDRVLLLFEPDPEDLAYVDPMPMSRLNDRRFAILPQTARRETVAFDSLSDLAAQARRLFPPAASSGAAIEVADDSIASYLVALHRALRDGVALEPVSTAASGSDTVTSCLPQSTSPAPVEFVLVESADDAERILGVQYAIVKNAPFAVCPEPDGRAVEAARAAIEKRSYAVPVASVRASADPVAALRAALFGDTSAPLLAALETATSAALPAEVVRAVGDLALTVLTTSTSYNFFARDGVTWADKPIGHVSGDASLLLFDELFPLPVLSEVGFNVVVDPQYITTDESAAVMGDLVGASSYPLALRGAAAASFTLGHVATTIPIDLLFFNTHGSDNGILLADMSQPLPAYEIVQRVTLRNRPLVFNNSCLSWVGVGREFIRIGARAYVGTLWSVHESEAALFASGAVARMVRGEAPAAAVRRSGVKAVDARAYIFVGTASALFARSQMLGALDAGGRRLRIAGLMLNSADTLLGMPTVDIFNGTILAYVALLLAQSEALLAQCDEVEPIPSAERIDDLAMQMRVHTRLLSVDPTSQQPASLLAAWRAKLAAADGIERLRPRALFFAAASRIYERTGNWRCALPLLEQSIADATACGDPPTLEYLALARFLAAGGRFRDAFERTRLAAQSLDGKIGPIAAELYHAQCTIALGLTQSADALEFATLGFAQADARDDLRGRAIAKNDEAASYLSSGDAANALTSATEALRLARLTYDSELEGDANDGLARAFVASDRIADAKPIVERELALARERRRSLAIASLLDISGDIAMHGGDAGSATGFWQQAIQHALCVGRPMFETRVLTKIRSVALDSRDASAWLTMLLCQVAIVDDLDEPMRSRVVADFASSFDRIATAVAPPALVELERQASALAPVPGLTVGNERTAMIERVRASLKL